VIKFSYDLPDVEQEHILVECLLDLFLAECVFTVLVVVRFDHFVV
jgi:hypothetical protein